MKIFQQGETVEILGYTYNYDDVLIARDGLTVTIHKPDGTEALSETSMSVDGVGVYIYNYTLASDAEIGVWTITIIVTSGTSYTIENDLFGVKRSI